MDGSNPMVGPAPEDRFPSLSAVTLLVVDVQNDFAHERGKSSALGADLVSARKAVESINRLIAAARGLRLPVVYLRTEHSLLTDRPNFKARYVVRGFDPENLLCAAGTWGAELYEDLAPPSEGEAVVTKYGYDGFQDTCLDAVLNNRGTRTLVVTGLVTNLCVQTTVEHAFALGYEVIIVEDATAGDDLAAQKAALTNLGKYFGTVVGTREVLESWNQTPVSGRQP